MEENNTTFIFLNGTQKPTEKINKLTMDYVRYSYLDVGKNMKFKRFSEGYCNSIPYETSVKFQPRKNPVAIHVKMACNLGRKIAR